MSATLQAASLEAFLAALSRAARAANPAWPGMGDLVEDLSRHLAASALATEVERQGDELTAQLLTLLRRGRLVAQQLGDDPSQRDQQNAVVDHGLVQVLRGLLPRGDGPLTVLECPGLCGLVILHGVLPADQPAGALLGRDRVTVWAWIRRGAIPGEFLLRAGNRTYVRRDWAEAR